MSESPTREVALPVSIVDRVETRLPRTEFDSVEEYVEFVLTQVLRGAESLDRPDETGVAGTKELESRLESLGYL